MRSGALHVLVVCFKCLWFASGLVVCFRCVDVLQVFGGVLQVWWSASSVCGVLQVLLLFFKRLW